MSKKPKIGRPPRARVAADVRVEVRMTQPEYDVIAARVAQANAESDGPSVTVSSWLRDRALA